MTKFIIIAGACFLVALPVILASNSQRLERNSDYDLYQPVPRVDKDEQRFERNGRQYTVVRERLEDGSVRVEVPQQDGTDQAVVLHNSQRGLTVFKDVTIGACFLTHLERAILTSGGPLVHYVPEDTQTTRTDYNLVPYGQNIDNLEEVAGDEIAGLCKGFPTWHALMKENGNGLAPPSNRRQKRWGWSSSVAVGINQDGSIERCFKTDSGDSAATGCMAGGASSSGTAVTNSTHNNTGPEEEKSGGFIGWIKSLFGRSKRSSAAHIREKRWTFSSSSSLSVDADGKVHRCSQTDSGNNKSSTRCQSGGAFSAGSASDGKNETDTQGGGDDDDGSFFDWLFGRD